MRIRKWAMAALLGTMLACAPSQAAMIEPYSFWATAPLTFTMTSGGPYGPPPTSFTQYSNGTITGTFDRLGGAGSFYVSGSQWGGLIDQATAHISGNAFTMSGRWNGTGSMSVTLLFDHVLTQFPEDAAGFVSGTLSGNSSFHYGGMIMTGPVTFLGGAVPEPPSWALMIAGFGLAGAALRQRKGTVSKLALAT